MNKSTYLAAQSVVDPDFVHHLQISYAQVCRRNDQLRAQLAAADPLIDEAGKILAVQDSSWGKIWLNSYRKYCDDHRRPPSGE